jgi:alpha-L-fucosidase
LKQVGAWLSKYGESIYGTRGNIIPAQDWGTVTATNKKLFVHILNQSAQDFVLLPRLTDKVISVNVLSTKTSLKWKQQPEGIFIYTGGMTVNDIDEIIEVTLK